MEDQQQQTTRWEYKLVTMGNPLEPGVEERANAFGNQSWELVAIDAGVWVFKRALTHAADDVESLRALVEQTVPLVEDIAPIVVTPTTATANGEGVETTNNG